MMASPDHHPCSGEVPTVTSFQSKPMRHPLEHFLTGDLIHTARQLFAHGRSFEIYIIGLDVFVAILEFM